MTEEMTNNGRTRDEHIIWCKERAHEYLAHGDLQNAVASMLSDMGKSPDCRVNPALSLYAMMCVAKDDYDGVRRFIDGFR